MTEQRHLTCACCGDAAGRWQQHWNQDTGFGLCFRCAEWIKGRDRVIDFESTYGKPGINYEESYSTELTPEGEQTVIPGCERQTTLATPQGNLF